MQDAGACPVNEMLARRFIRRNRVTPVRPVLLSANEGYFLSVNRQSRETSLFVDWISRIASKKPVRFSV